MPLFFFLGFQCGVLRERGNRPFLGDAHSLSIPIETAALAPGGKGNILIEEVLMSATHAEPGYLEELKRM